MGGAMKKKKKPPKTWEPFDFDFEEHEWDFRNPEYDRPNKPIVLSELVGIILVDQSGIRELKEG